MPLFSTFATPADLLQCLSMSETHPHTSKCPSVCFAILETDDQPFKKPVPTLHSPRAFTGHSSDMWATWRNQRYLFLIRTISVSGVLAQSTLHCLSYLILRMDLRCCCWTVLRLHVMMVQGPGLAFTRHWRDEELTECIEFCFCCQVSTVENSVPKPSNHVWHLNPCCNLFI